MLIFLDLVTELCWPAVLRFCTKLAHYLFSRCTNQLWIVYGLLDTQFFPLPYNFVRVISFDNTFRHAVDYNSAGCATSMAQSGC
jgi:hypothetical protein